MSKVTKVNQLQFETEVLQSDLPVLVDFYADWCPPCRALTPVLDRLSEEFAGRVKIVKVNGDEEPELAEKYQVTALPTLVFVQNGNVVDQFSGLPQETALREKLDHWANSFSIAQR